MKALYKMASEKKDEKKEETVLSKVRAGALSGGLGSAAFGGLHGAVFGGGDLKQRAVRSLAQGAYSGIDGAIVGGLGGGLIGQYEKRKRMKKKAEFVPNHTTGSSRRTMGPDPKTGNVKELNLPQGTTQNSDVKANILSKMIRV